MMSEVNERAHTILRSIVECYLKLGQPVGSSTLAKHHDIGYSASTIRSVMSELEEGGYLHSPHTSSGRVPTAQGYRIFVDSLLQTPVQNEPSIAQIKSVIASDLSSKAVLDNTSLLMSDLTSLCSLISLPKRNEVIIEHMEFLPLADQRILVIVVLEGGEVQNRIIAIEDMPSPEALKLAAAFINEHFSGMALAQARQALLNILKADHEKMESKMKSVVALAEQAVSQTHQNDMLIAGQNHLLDMANGGDIGGLKSLFQAFSDKHSILNLLDKCLLASQVQIFIGEESGHRMLQECSVIAAPYSTKNKQIGVLAVIGPTRMDYKRVIPVVDITAKMLSSTLNND